MKRKTPIIIDLSTWSKEVGATISPGGDDISVPTICGSLRVKACPSSTGGAWIACRFEDVDKAKTHFGVTTLGHQLNPFSGKWNFMDGLACDQQGVDMMVARFKREVALILPKAA